MCGNVMDFTSETGGGVSIIMKPSLDLNSLQWDHHSTFWEVHLFSTHLPRKGSPSASYNPVIPVHAHPRSSSFCCVLFWWISVFFSWRANSSQSISVGITWNLRARFSYWSVIQTSCRKLFLLILLKPWITMALLIKDYLQMGTSLGSVICLWK